MSTIKANKIQTLGGFTYNLPVQVVTSSLGAADLGTTDTATSDRTNPSPAYGILTNTTTWTDTTNLQLTITPKFSNSIMKCELSVYTLSTVASNPAAIRVKRGNKIVWRPIHNTTGPFSNFYIDAANLHATPTVIFMDAPGTTSPVTYSLQYRTYNGGFCSFFGTGASTWCNGQYFIVTEYAQ